VREKKKKELYKGDENGRLAILPCQFVSLSFSRSWFRVVFFFNMAGLTRFRLKEIVLGTKQSECSNNDNTQNKSLPIKINRPSFSRVFFWNLLHYYF
jgi:hypothetical protein